MEGILPAIGAAEPIGHSGLLCIFPYFYDLHGSALYDFYHNALLEAQQLDGPLEYFDAQEMRETLAEFERINFYAFP